MLQLMDHYSGGWNVLLIAFCECISIAYVYGKLTVDGLYSCRFWAFDWP